MCFMMNPQEIPHDATWTGKYFHLTYAGFIDKDIFLEMVRGATTVPLIGWSICHPSPPSTPSPQLSRFNNSHLQNSL